LLQEHVGADEEFLGPSGDDLVDLVARQPAALEDLAGQRKRLGLLGLWQGGEFFQLLGLEQAAGSQLVEERRLDVGRHEAPSLDVELQESTWRARSRQRRES